MNTSTANSGGIDKQPFGDGAITRVRFRGWIVDVDTDDLRTCMAAQRVAS